jgi:hypothetical protein
VPVLVVKIRMVPAGTLPPAVPEFEDPAVGPVVNERTAEPMVQVTEFVDGFTVVSTQVVVAPEYDQTVNAGLQAVGAITEGIPFNVAC